MAKKKSKKEIQKEYARQYFAKKQKAYQAVHRVTKSGGA